MNASAVAVAQPQPTLLTDSSQKRKSAVVAARELVSVLLDVILAVDQTAAAADVVMVNAIAATARRARLDWGAALAVGAAMAHALVAIIRK